MKKNFLPSEIQTVFFIGIGGVSMSGLAEILHRTGLTVLGSDRSSNASTQHLKSIGIQIYEEHRKEHITDDIDLVVYTAAIKTDNVEYVESQRNNILMYDRATLLGAIMKQYEYPICVSGIHGKTTTTGMISQVFLTNQLDPTITIGGNFQSIQSNFKMGESPYFIAEACEYCDSFLKFFPYVGIILNVEEDHLDYFTDIHHIVRSFHQFASNILPNGVLILNNAIKYFPKIADNLNCKVQTFGNDDANFYSKEVVFDKLGCASFDIMSGTASLGRVQLKVPGQHNVSNALAVVAACCSLGLSAPQIIRGLEAFTGTDRRFQLKGMAHGVTVIDDYAHHPTEIKVTLAAIKNTSYHRVWAVFQPHTYSRTLALLEDFSEAFYDADEVIVLDIYAAREPNNGEIHAKDLVTLLQKKGVSAIYMPDMDKCVTYLTQKCIPNDLLITLGAGDVYIVGNEMLRTDLST